MTSFKIIKLNFLSPFHIGTGKEDLSSSEGTIQSDMLYAAISSIKAENGCSSESLLTFLNSFELSSCFPFFGNHLFFPMPKGYDSIKVKDQEDYQYRKRLKKIKYIEQGVWQEIIKGGNISVSENQIHGEYLMDVECSFHYPVKYVTQRVSVNRNGEDAAPFYFEWTHFTEGSGLYCIIQAEDDSIIDEVVNLMSTLGERGIGTDRSVGGGQFEISSDTINLDLPESSESYELMSTFIPCDDDLESLNFNCSNFAICERSGYMAGSSINDLRHLLRKSVRMILPGSILRSTSPLKGKIVDLKPEWNSSDIHSAFRSGRAIILPINI